MAILKASPIAKSVSSSLRRSACRKIHGWRAEKSRHKFIVGFFEQRLWCALLLNIAAMHDNNSVGQSHCFDLVVGHIDHIFFDSLPHDCQFGRAFGRAI